MRQFALVLGIALLAGPGTARAKDDHEPSPVGSMAKSGHFVALCHFEDEAIAKATVGAAEAAWKPTLALMGRKAPKLDKRIETHVYATVTDFLAAEQRLTNGEFAKNLLFSHYDTRAMYGVLLPDCDATVRERLGMRPHHLRQIAHEASHLTVYASVVNHRAHPDWLAEGMATWVAEQISRDRGWSKTGEETPFYSRRMFLCQRMRASGELPEPRAILQDNIGHLSHYDQYAVWWGFFRLCNESHADDLRKIIAAAIAQGGGPRFKKRLYATIQTIWSDQALDDLNDAWRSYVDGFTPLWDEDYRCLEPDGKRLTQVAFSDNNAMAFRSAPSKDRYTIRGTVEIAPARSAQANVYLGKNERGFYSITIRANSGLNLMEYRDGDWTRHKFVEHPLETDTPIRFEIKVTKDKLRVAIDGKEVLDAQFPRVPKGRWGLGVQAASGAVWTGVTLRE